MNDFQKAEQMIGNRFDMVLVASKRMREIHRARQKKLADGDITINLRGVIPAYQAISEIESGAVGPEYLEDIRRK